VSFPEAHKNADPADLADWSDVHAAEALTSPALLSQPPSRPLSFKPPLSRRMGGRLGERGLGE